MNTWLIRHAESTSNAGEATEYPLTIPLTDKGLEQAKKLADSFPRSPDLIVVSPFIRTSQTAGPLIKRFPKVSVQTWNVHEFTFLNPEKHRGTTQEQRHPFVEDYFRRDDPDYCDGGGAESFNQMLERASEMLSRIDPKIFTVVFTHGAFMRGVLMRLANPYGKRLLPSEFRKMDYVKNTQVIEI